MLRIHNTLTKTTQKFEPAKKKRVNMFVCGPTVYDYIHVGNGRTFVIFDMIAKYLHWRGFSVTYIQNITDIDDKIIRRAKEQGQKPEHWAREYERYFLEDVKALGIDSVSQYARATDHIPQVVEQVKKLIAKKNAYFIEGDGYYFDLSTFPEYGKLSGRTTDMAEDSVSRIDENEQKRNPGDFCLWKLSKEGEPRWHTELGDGRPGWHIEDTAITEYYFGPQYDLHGGGPDLIFPHHEAEIAQQESISGTSPFVRYWMHPGFLQTKGDKMSKSLGNIMTVREALTRYSPETLRLYFLSAHYRTPLQFSEDGLAQAQTNIARITEFMERLTFYEEKHQKIKPAGSQQPMEFREMLNRIKTSMDDDLNSPEALAVLFDVIRIANSKIDTDEIDLRSIKALLDILDFYDSVFGIIPHHRHAIPVNIQELVRKREDARKNKNFQESDDVRIQIDSLGYTVDDTSSGPIIKKK